MSTIQKSYTVAEALAQIKSCQFECEGGPLANNTAWQFLEAALKVGPEFWPGQGVWFEVKAEAAGQVLKQWTFFFVVGCRMESDTDRRFWTYSLSYDPPGPWHYGETQLTKVHGSQLRTENPSSGVIARNALENPHG
mgnify:CR=1 FL=1